MRKYDVNGRKKLAEICIGKGADMGCADLKITENCIGVDFDPSANPDILSNIQCDIFDDESLDFIVSSHSLEHVNDVNATLKRWCLALKYKGKIGILVPHGEYAAHTTLGPGPNKHHYLFTPKTIKIYLERAGFKHIKVKIIKRPYAWKQKPAIVAIGQK